MLGLNGMADAIWTEADGEVAAEIADASATVAEECREEINAVTASHRIEFRSGSPYYINPPAQRLLDRLAEAVNGCDGIRIEISGHGNGGGRPIVNMELSAFCTTTVRDVLIERGVPAEILTTIGKDASDPLDENPGDPASRRVAFTVTLANEKAG